MVLILSTQEGKNKLVSIIGVFIKTLSFTIIKKFFI